VRLLDAILLEQIVLEQIVDAGLCETCLHSRRIISDRGSVFFLCQLSFSNPQFRKYPRLPVSECPGYAAGNRAKEAPEREGGPYEG
jgi:hypothetical protein